MSVDYRLLQAADELAAIAWWAAEYQDDPSIIASAFRSDPRCFERSFVARESDGSIRAAVAYWIRILRDAAGAPRRVGHIWGIGTPGDAADVARQQHVDRLVDLAQRAAQHDGCELLLLYPAPETHAHYQQRGWQLFPNMYRQGTFTGVQLPTTATYTIRQYDPTQEPGGWEQLAEVYRAYNATRPASVVRDAAYWRDYLSWRWGEWYAHGSSIFLVATPVRDPATLCGYIIPKFYPDAFLIAELGVRPSDTAVIPPLLAAVMEENARRGISDRFRVYLPGEPDIDSWLHELFGTTMHEGSYGTHTVYALAAEITQDDLTAMFTASGNRAWLLDQF
jgi:hypothetical protein